MNKTSELKETAKINKVSREIIAHDFHVSMHGKLADKQIEAVKKTLLSTTNAYHATGSVVSMIFYLQFQVNIDNGKSFNGKAGGISSPGGGALIGDVYTDDLERLYRDTVSFEFNCTPVYTSLIFFDSHSNCLGSYQSGSISTVAGVGGGSGKWS